MRRNKPDKGQYDQDQESGGQYNLRPLIEAFSPSPAEVVDAVDVAEVGVIKGEVVAEQSLGSFRDGEIVDAAEVFGRVRLAPTPEEPPVNVAQTNYPRRSSGVTQIQALLGAHDDSLN